MVPLYTLLFVIFLEGYVVLSAELLAMRLLVPYTGSGTDTIAIIIAAVLMPLAFGYNAGGKFLARRKTGVNTLTVRKKLLVNLTTAAVFFTLGLSYLVISKSYDWIYQTTGLNNRIIYTILYAATFLVLPIYLLGQTVPLVSQFFRRQNVAQFTGKILFFSTMGSFIGSVFCTLVLMSFLGVHYAVVVTIGCMLLIAILLAKRKTAPTVVIIFTCLLVALVLNSDQAMQSLRIVQNDQYGVVQIKEYNAGEIRAMLINRSIASIIYTGTKEPFAEYIQYINQNFIDPTLNRKDAPKDFLVLGAGGFTVGMSDTYNNYTSAQIRNLSRCLRVPFFVRVINNMIW